MLLGDTLILDDLDSANAYRQEVDTIYMYYVTTNRLCSRLCMLEFICTYEGLVMMPISTHVCFVSLMKMNLVRQKEYV